MTAEEKIQFARIFLDCIRKGTECQEAQHPANRAFAARAIGLCDILDAALDGDVQRAFNLAQDMPLRMHLAHVEDK